MPTKTVPNKKYEALWVKAQELSGESYSKEDPLFWGTAMKIYVGLIKSKGWEVPFDIKSPSLKEMAKKTKKRKKKGFVVIALEANELADLRREYGDWVIQAHEEMGEDFSRDWIEKRFVGIFLDDIEFAKSFNDDIGTWLTNSADAKRRFFKLEDYTDHVLEHLDSRMVPDTVSPSDFNLLSILDKKELAEVAAENDIRDNNFPADVEEYIDWEKYSEYLMESHTKFDNGINFAYLRRE